jgi:hypothetical protein
VDFANDREIYVPGMYAMAQLPITQVARPINLPATALVIRAGPPQVVIVRPDSTVRYQNIQLGRDHGAWLEVTGGLANGATVVINAPDNLENGARVRTVFAPDTTATGARSSATGAATPSATSTPPAATGNRPAPSATRSPAPRPR